MPSEPEIDTEQQEDLTPTPTAPKIQELPAIVPLKPPTPSIYSGARDKRAIDDFLWSLECYFRFFPNLKDEHKLVYAAAFVRGAAQTWIRHITFASYDDFVKKLEAEFSPVDYRMNLFDRWECITQTTSVEKYSREFFELKMTLKLKFPEEYLIQKYIKGLKPRIKLAVVGQNPRTLEDATQIAQRVDMLTYQKHPQHSPPSQQFHQRNAPRQQQRPIHDPMDLDNIRLQKLTSGEKERLKKEGCCFRCRQPGHLAKNCKGLPRPQQVNSITTDSFQQT